MSFDKNRNDYLLPLIIKGPNIFNKEDKIQERLREEQLKQEKKNYYYKKNNLKEFLHQKNLQVNIL